MFQQARFSRRFLSSQAHRVLQVHANATMEELKAALKHQQRTWHPDRHGDSAEAAEKFKQATEAFNTIVGNSAQTGLGWQTLRRAHLTNEFRSRHGFSVSARPEGLVNMPNSLFILGIFVAWALASEEPQDSRNQHFRKRLNIAGSGWG